MKGVILLLFLHAAVGSITKLATHTFNDNTKWVSASGDPSGYHLWVSETTATLVQPAPDSSSISIIFSSSIPENYQSSIYYLNGVDLLGNEGDIDVLCVTHENPYAITRFSISSPGGEWNISSVTQLPPTEYVYSKTANRGTNSNELYFFAIDQIASVQVYTSSIVAQANTSVPLDPNFKVNTVVNGGVPLLADNFAIMVRSSNGTNGGGDVVVVDINSNGGMEFDHQSYLLDPPQAFFFAEDGEVSDYFYWLQTDGSDGYVYEYEYSGYSMDYLDIPFSSGQTWSTAFSFPFGGQKAMIAYGYNQHTAGYKLIQLDLYPISAATTYTETSDTLPTIGLEADYTESESYFSVFGTRDSSTGHLKLALFAYDMNDNSVASKSESRSFFNMTSNVHGGPPGCSANPSCINAGKGCANPTNCYLAQHAWYCCSQCPGSC